MNLPIIETGTWEHARTKDGKLGTGNWSSWGGDIAPIYAAAEKWKQQLTGIDNPWLCWNLDDDWCVLQQKLVLSIGWTPIVGNDTNVSSPTILKGSHYINFNLDLKLPNMWMHFPLEFAFLFSEKMAFWHSDLLCSEMDMKKYAIIFSSLKQGEMAAAKHTHSFFNLKDRSKNRYFELIGCTTKMASESQFKHGCGWWRNIEVHPNFRPEDHPSDKYYYEHGKGIWVWDKVYNGKVKSLRVNEKDGHCTAYLKNLPRQSSKSEELKEQCDLRVMAKNLGIEHLLK